MSTIPLKKEFGQNFLTDRGIAQRFVEYAGIDENDFVLEVGPGAGMVTQYLIRLAKKVVAIEIDARFAALSQTRFCTEPNFQIINEDIMKINVIELGLTTGSYKVIGSLPYNISKQIIKKFIEENNPPSSLTIIIQKEVAEDYVAQIPKATFLSNYVQMFGSAQLLEIISKEKFKPVPKVDGAIMRITLNKDRSPFYREFNSFLKACFITPRKMLSNNLRALTHLDRTHVLKIFKEIGIVETSRPSELDFPTWRKLYEKVNNFKK